MSERTLPDDPRALEYGQYIENDGEIWQVVGHTEEDGLPIIRKCDPEDVPEYRESVADDGS